MAVHDISTWLPEEFGGPVIQRITQLSVIEQLARRVPMTTLTRHVPRSGGMGMDILGGGDAYGEDASTDDEVLLTARKLGKAISLTEEDLADVANIVDVIGTKKDDWATAYAKTLDNACLGTTGAESVAGDIPFTSVYKAVRTTNSGLSYTADTNYVQSGTNLGAVTFTDTGDVVTFNQPHGLVVGDRVVPGTITTTTGITAGTTYYVKTVPSTTTVTLSATSGGSTLALTTDGSSTSVTKLGVGYDNLSNTLSLVEASDWFDDANTVVIAHPKYKAKFRNVKDSQQRPIFVSAADRATPDTLFDYPVYWSLGARCHATANPNPTGNPLLIVGSRQSLILGVRSGPESFIADGTTGVGFSTDETKMKMRARRGFGISHPAAFAVLEDAS